MEISFVLALGSNKSCWNSSLCPENMSPTDMCGDGDPETFAKPLDFSYNSKNVNLSSKQLYCGVSICVLPCNFRFNLLRNIRSA